MSRLAVEADLQASLFEAGIVWRLVPLLFRYDATLEAAGVEGKAEHNEQKVRLFVMGVIWLHTRVIMVL